MTNKELNKMSRKVCFEAGYKQAKEEFEKMIDEIKMNMDEVAEYLCLKAREKGYRLYKFNLQKLKK
jgi:hypothetical protein